MSIHPEIRSLKVPSIALAAAALLSLTIKAESSYSADKHSPRKLVNTENVDLRLKPEPRVPFITNMPLFDIIKINHNGTDNNPNAATTTSSTKVSPSTTTTTTAPPPPPLTPAQIAANEVSPEMFAEWSKVNICEESGNWYVYGNKYSGGLGISNTNWIAYGGQEFAPNGAEATPDEQIVVASRIQSSPPDQNGCGGGW